MENGIIELCSTLNKAIHEPLYHYFYNIPDELNYNQTFTSIDLIEDSQIAIEEYKNAKSNGKKGRSTLLIYGLLQAFFLQQDGLYHLYKCIVNNKINQTNFFDLFSFDKDIREVRNDIAGHPTNRKNTEFYFIAKGPISKDRFTYAGYTPTFRAVKVDINSFISKQSEFANTVLQTIKDDISKKIEMQKREHKNKSLKEMIVGLDRNIEFIFRGIRDEDRTFQGEWGISGAKVAIDEIREELNLRFNENLPSGISDAFRMIDYIILRFDQWWTEKTLFGNDDAEIFLDSLEKQINELEEMLVEIEKEFNS
ncbi:hypothetical protein [uncultured Algoriphagus sp.]|uniref:hypothetical protein n=1 Tax=uncultured Algoriphagus sp. TaxID=417365 RepID=UPI0030EE9C04|tara:strand:+ start:29393 stop:30322 length:930 start_codon:yes stop_codon:yes gene_type:complete